MCRKPLNVNLEDLVRFGVLAEELSFRRAAARLGISQPSLTRRVHRLERESGVYLVERYSNRIRLTAAGEVFADRAPRVAEEIARIRTEIADVTRGRQGRLSIGSFVSLSSGLFHRVLSRFGASNALRLELREGTAHQQLIALRQHRIDLAVTVGPIEDSAVNVESLWTERLIVVAHPDHPVRAKTSVSWSEVAAERLVLRGWEHDHSIADYLSNLAATAGARPQITEFFTSRESIVGLVRAGFGIAILPESSVMSLNTAELSCISMAGPGTAMEIVAAWLPENANPALRVFLEEITLAARENRSASTPRVGAPLPTPTALESPDPTQ
jgi:DNA-binding transcriptional LysR family regulator